MKSLCQLSVPGPLPGQPLLSVSSQYLCTTVTLVHNGNTTVCVTAV